MAHEEGKASNKMGFGFDQIFKPDSSYKTLAQTDGVEKSKRLHRAATFRKFAE
jgi:inosine/xanthosine triphosphate pyrophosphatase family protein